MADAIDLQTRLPLTWAAVEQLTLEDWVARKIGDRWPAVERLLLGSSKTPVYTGIDEVEDEGAAG